MKVPIYFINSFTDQLYTGNPAAVCVLERSLPDNQLQKIAAEVHLPATTFLLKDKGDYHIRWFAPEYEIDLCGHGTLASGYVIFNILEPKLNQVKFLHPIKDSIHLTYKDSYLIIDFPAKNIEPINPQDILLDGLGQKPTEVYQYEKERLLVIYDKEDIVLKLQPNRDLLKKIEHRGIIISSRGNKVDFVSRVFYPHKESFEDQATGSSHCLLVPYWSQVLKKEVLQCQQLSKRMGHFVCKMQDNRIFIHGKAVLYLQGTLDI